jgi:hypothetical protein
MLKCPNCKSDVQISSNTVGNIQCQCGYYFPATLDVESAELQAVEPTEAAKVLSEEFQIANRMSTFESEWREHQQAKQFRLQMCVGAIALLLFAGTGYLRWRYLERAKRQKENLALQILADELQHQQDEAEVALQANDQRKKIEVALQIEERHNQEKAEAARQTEFKRLKDLEKAKGKKDEANHTLSIGILAAIEAKKVRIGHRSKRCSNDKWQFLRIQIIPAG